MPNLLTHSFVSSNFIQINAFSFIAKKKKIILNDRDAKKEVYSQTRKMFTEKTCFRNS